MANFFDVVALDDECTQWACQRELDGGGFETIGDFADHEKAQIECDRLNEEVEADDAALEAELAPFYGRKA